MARGWTRARARWRGHGGSAGLSRTYWLTVGAALLYSIALLVVYAPVDASMGVAQKLVYLHVPAAINAFLACGVVSLASVAYVWQRQRVWDDIAHAAAEVSVIFCAVVLITGAVWGREAWGRWWMWSPRLTFSLILLLLYAAYLFMRRAIASPERRALVCAIYGSMAFLDVPLVYLSTRLLSDIHPAEMALTPPMRHTLWMWMVSITLLCGGLIVARVAHHQRARRVHVANEAPTPVMHPRMPFPGARA